LPLHGLYPERLITAHNSSLALVYRAIFYVSIFDRFKQEESTFWTKESTFLREFRKDKPFKAKKKPLAANNVLTIPLKK